MSHEYKRQASIRVEYEDVVLGIGFRSDIIMEDKLLVEIKSVEQLEKVRHKIRLTGMKLGILVNFSVHLTKEGIHRKISGKLE